MKNYETTNVTQNWKKNLQIPNYKTSFLNIFQNLYTYMTRLHVVIFFSHPVSNSMFGAMIYASLPSCCLTCNQCKPYISLKIKLDYAFTDLFDSFQAEVLFWLWKEMLRWKRWYVKGNIWNLVKSNTDLITNT